MEGGGEQERGGKEAECAVNVTVEEKEREREVNPVQPSGAHNGSRDTHHPCMLQVGRVR